MPNPSPRYISNLTRETYALILAGGGVPASMS